MRVSTRSNWRDSKTWNGGGNHFNVLKMAKLKGTRIGRVLREISKNSQFMFTHRTIASESDVIAFSICGRFGGSIHCMSDASSRPCDVGL